MPNLFIFHIASFLFIGVGILIPTFLLAPNYIKEFLFPRVVDGQISNVLPILCATLVLHLFIYLHGFSNKKSIEKILKIIKEDKPGSFGRAFKLMAFGDKNSKK